MLRVLRLRSRPPVKALSSADGAPDLFAYLVQHQPALRQNCAQGLEVMDHPVVACVFDGNPRRDQFCRIGIALVAHRVELGGMDDGGGSPANFVARKGEILGSARSAPSGR